jgi:ATP-dependent Clp protease ATP-binding subunit ClpX
MEKVLLPIMYTAPSDPSIEKITVSKECVVNGELPVIQRNPARLTAAKEALKPTIA